MRPKSMVLILIALACGLVASIGISQVVDKKSSQQEQSQTAPVYVAAVDVPIHEKLTAPAVRREEWPIDRIPPGAVTKLEDIDGRKPTSPLYKGEVILGARLVDPNSRVMNSSRIPKGYRVVSVKVQMDSAVSGLLSPGDRVDVLGYFRQNGTTSSQTKTILTDITVFAINDRISRHTDEEEGSLEAKTVSLTVTPKQAQRLLLAAELGQIKLSLRNNEDDGDEVPEKTGYEDLAPSGVGMFGGQQQFTPPPVRQQVPSFRSQGIQMEVMSPAGTESYTFKDRNSLPTKTSEQSNGGAAFPAVPSSNNNDAESGGGDGGFDFDSLSEDGGGEGERAKTAEEILQID